MIDLAGSRSRTRLQSVSSQWRGKIDDRQHKIRLLHGLDRPSHAQAAPPGRRHSGSQRCPPGGWGCPRSPSTPRPCLWWSPAMSDTMARSLISRAFRSELLPTLGLPTMAVRSPCSKARPRKAVRRSLSRSACTEAKPSASDPQSRKSTSSSEKSTVASIRASRPIKSRLAARSFSESPPSSCLTDARSAPGASGRDDCRDTLCLCEIDPSVQKRTPGELPWLRQASARVAASSRSTARCAATPP